MARPPVFPAEEKVRIVLSILDAGMPTHEVLCGHRRARADLAPPSSPRTGFSLAARTVASTGP
jgi:hypothetical protein